MKHVVIWLYSLLLLCIAGCDQAPAPAQPLPAAVDFTGDPATHPEKINDHLIHSALDSHIQACASAEALQNAITTLLDHPNPFTLAASRDAWRDSYSAFLRARLYGFLPVTDPVEWQRQGLSYHQTLSLIDSWPIEGGYIDYLPGYPFTGIVNDLTLPLSSDTLQQQHGFADPASVSLGFHVIEFLLWGSDGQRSASDYLQTETITAVAGSSSNKNTATHADNTADNHLNKDTPPGVINQDRRRQYLQRVTAQLLDHLRRLQRRWERETGYYARLVASSTPAAALQAGMSASARLIRTELLEKRLPGNSSEFSATSQQDSLALLQGMQLWLLGSESHPGALVPLLSTTQPDLLRQWQTTLAQALNQAPAPESNTTAEQQHTPSATAAITLTASVQQLDTLLQQTASVLRLTLPDTH
ncbi:imelysin family protein [Oceanobacter antarcticus]|uniref:Imelysin family protein n=1 Tax=Oceanobacter antarcticus TaxID=3133425 RepID=A0ABW8NHJ5_9GAMM